MISNWQWFENRLDTDNVDDLGFDLNHIIRSNPSYEFRIIVTSIYGTISSQLYKDGNLIHSEIGMTLSKRIRNAIRLIIKTERENQSK